MQMCVWNNNVIWQTPAISAHGSDIQMSGGECVQTAGIEAPSEDQLLLLGKAGVCVFQAAVIRVLRWSRCGVIAARL